MNQLSTQMEEQSMQMEEQSMQMEKITEQIIVSRRDFLDNYLKYYNALEISSSTKLLFKLSIVRFELFI